MSIRASADGAGRPHGLGRAGRLVVALGLALLVFVGTSGESTHAATGASPAAGPAQPSTVTVELVDQPTWVRPGERIDVQVRVTGEPAGATLDMVVHEPVESRSAFRRTLDRPKVERYAFPDLDERLQELFPEAAARPAGRDAAPLFGLPKLFRR